MNCMIVDDEEMSRELLKGYCEKVDGLNLVSIGKNGLEAISALEKLSIDVMFLDIEMPELTGMELLKSSEKLPEIVLTTSSKDHALEAFEYQVADYITKPVSFPRFLKAIERVKDILKVGRENKDEIFIKVDGRYVKLRLEDILFIETLGDYVVFVTEDNKKYIVHSTLKNIEEKIKDQNFLKVHRSYVVNLSKIIDIEESNLLISDKVIPISRSQKPVLMNRINLI